MGKNKNKQNKNSKHKSGGKHQFEQKAKKDTSVFRVAGSKVAKSKNKAKPITTTLKKLEKKSVVDVKIQKANAAFNEDVRSKLMTAQRHKVAAPSSKHKTLVEKTEVTPVDMDAAASEFAKL